MSYTTEQIARDVANDQGNENWWHYYHPIVRWTINWLEEHDFVRIVDEQPTGVGTGIPPEGP